MTKRRTKGEGSIYFNDRIGRYFAQITLPNGQRRSKSSKTQKVFRDWLIEQRHKVNAGLFVKDE